MSDPDPTHLQVVRSGPEAINSWRRDHPGQHMNLGSVDLSGAEMQSCDLRHANLLAANLQGANLERARLDSACLMGAKLGAYLSECALDDANLEDADLRGAYLRNASLLHANLRHANLKGADLRDADFKRANLSGAQLHGANLWGATNLNLYGSSGYVLDGQDISSWRIPPVQLLPSIRRHYRRPMQWRPWKWRPWKWRPWRWRPRLALHWEYVDPWTKLRHAYTGFFTFVHLSAALCALAPFIAKALLADARSHGGTPRIVVALGGSAPDAWMRSWLCIPDWWILIATGLAILTYNLFRIVATWWLSQLRERESWSGQAPRFDQYRTWHQVHSSWAMRCFAVSVIVFNAVRIVLWIFEPV